MCTGALRILVCILFWVALLEVKTPDLPQSMPLFSGMFSCFILGQVKLALFSVDREEHCLNFP